MKNEVMTIHDVRNRIDWCHERITEVNAHVINNSNMLDANDMSSLRQVWQYLSDLRSSKCTNSVM